MAEPLPNIAALAARRALGLEAPGADEPDPERDPLAPLRALPEDADLETVEKELRDLTVRASGRDRLGLALLREGAIRELERIKVSSPARLVDAALGAISTNNAEAAGYGQGHAIFLTDPDPWPDPVDGAALLDELRRTFERFVVLPKGASTALALSVVLTHAYDAFTVCPRVAITSPTKRCGKSTLLTLLSGLVPRPLPSVNMSAASLFRAVEEYHPTLLVDEADRFLGDKEDLIGLLNAGHYRPLAYVTRVVGDANEVRAFSVWAPAIIALIGRLPDTIADRSVSIPMRRKTKEEKVERLRLDRLGELETLQRKAWRWAQDNMEALRAADPDVPSALHDRAQDNWRPLLAIADLAGGDWPEKARKAARILSATTNKDDEDIAVTLLGDLRSIFKAREASRMATSDLLDALCAMEDRPWGDWKGGKPISPQGLARLLKRFNVSPRHERNWRGYIAADLTDAWGRYLEASQASPAHRDAGFGDSPNRHTAPVRDGYANPGKSDGNGVVTHVTVTLPQEDPEEVF